ncbi:lipopolysaccharide biosynthesis protein [Gracilibacillus kekensis]|uniref:lipopolysaccharide biosynthesis protein n=1 Tax=Gracilibacillus kekensis TaxID=1027249 RepID=UPI000934D6DB|nr:oligosaccharide flippase family protein [Gracilibacillus kekensis]
MFKKLFQSATIYVSSTILNAAVPFFLIPIYTRNMSTEDYGLFSMFQMVLLIFGPVVGLSIHGAVTRQYFERDKIDFAKYVTNTLLVLLSSTVIISVLNSVFSNIIFNLTDLNWRWIQLAILVAASQFLFQVVLVLFQVQHQPYKYGAFLISQSMLNGILSIVLVVNFNMGWQGAVLGLSISYILYGFIGIFIIKSQKLLKFQYSYSYIKHAIKFGVPLIPVVLGMALINVSDRLFIKNIVGIEAAGIYTIGYQISMILMIVINSFNKAWVPWFFERLKLDQLIVRKRIVKFTYFYFIIVIVAAVVLGILSPYIISFYVAEEFHDASKFVLWISIGYAFNGMYKMMTNYVHYAQKTHLNFGVMIIVVPLNLILNNLFITHFGAIGASYASALSFLLAFVLMWVLSSKVYSMPWFSLLKKR